MCVRLVFFSWSSALTCFVGVWSSGTLHLKGACGNACPNPRGVCGNAHSVVPIGLTSKLQNVVRERYSAQSLILLRKRWGALLDNLDSANWVVEAGHNSMRLLPTSVSPCNCACFLAGQMLLVSFAHMQLDAPGQWPCCTKRVRHSTKPFWLENNFWPSFPRVADVSVESFSVGSQVFMCKPRQRHKGESWAACK